MLESFLSHEILQNHHADEQYSCAKRSKHIGKMNNNRVQKSKLGFSLRTARRDAKLNQAELADRVGLHRNVVVAVEAGRGHLTSLISLANAFKLEISGRLLVGDAPLGDRLARLRKRRRLSRRTVASMADISIPAIEACERGEAGHIAVLEAYGRAIGAGLCLVPKGQTGFWTSTATSSADMEWYTPAWLLERVMRVIGPFDTDPCSPGKGKSNVQASLHLTAVDDGLSLPWCGTVWLNPPYGNEIGRWLAKARDEISAGHATRVTALLPARTDTKWFHAHIAGKADILLLKGRVTFEQPQTNGSKELGAVSAPFPSALVGYGLSGAERDALFNEFPDALHIARKAEGLDQEDGMIALRE